MAAPEKETLVTSFDALRVGMIVRYKPCDFCGASHRTQLIRLKHGGKVGLNAETFDVQQVEQWWTCEPRLKCQPLKEAGISRLSVANRKIYRVEDGLETDAQHRKLELANDNGRPA